MSLDIFIMTIVKAHSLFFGRFLSTNFTVLAASIFIDYFIVCYKNCVRAYLIFRWRFSSWEMPWKSLKILGNRENLKNSGRAIFHNIAHLTYSPDALFFRSDTQWISAKLKMIAGTDWLATAINYMVFIF